MQVDGRHVGAAGQCPTAQDAGISIAGSDPIGGADSSLTFDNGGAPVTFALPAGLWSKNGAGTLFKYKNANAPGPPSVVGSPRSRAVCSRWSVRAFRSQCQTARVCMRVSVSSAPASRGAGARLSLTIIGSTFADTSGTAPASAVGPEPGAIRARPGQTVHRLASSRPLRPIPRARADAPAIERPRLNLDNALIRPVPRSCAAGYWAIRPL